MKKTIKIMLFLTLALITLLCIPNFCNAAETETATDEDTLNTAIQNVDEGGTVKVQNNITITKPISIQKELTIDGNGYTIVGSTEWTSTSGNQTMFTASSSRAKLILKNIDLNNGPKYGVQAYDGGTIILNNVSITGFRYGGVLVNGGNVEIIDLHLGTNGTGANNGIEIDQGAAVTSKPTLTMNGTLTSDSKENVVRPATNGNLTEFTITNTENTTNKVVIAGDKVVLTDENNNVISESTIPDNVITNTDEKKVIVTLIKGGKVAKQITIDEGTKVTKDLLKEDLTIEEGYEIEGFYEDQKYTNKFNFEKELTSDTTIYVKISKIEDEKTETIPDDAEEKDDVPKTGVESYLGISILVIVASIVSIYCINKKDR